MHAVLKPNGNAARDRRRQLQRQARLVLASGADPTPADIDAASLAAENEAARQTRLRDLSDARLKDRRALEAGESVCLRALHLLNEQVAPRLSSMVTKPSLARLLGSCRTPAPLITKDETLSVF